jgi:hypothetical protein
MPADLRIEVWDDEIIVTLPDTIYSVTYYTPAKSPKPLAKGIAERDKLAWRVANGKARELGWIV